jgi:hypothetical protein
MDGIQNIDAILDVDEIEQYENFAFGWKWTYRW